MSCEACPYKAPGVRWTKARQRDYCHGGVRPEKKGPRDGCAVLWPVWGTIGYHLETIALLKDGMPAPAHYTREEWRELHKVKAALEEWRLAEAAKEDA